MQAIEFASSKQMQSNLVKRPHFIGDSNNCCKRNWSRSQTDMVVKRGTDTEMGMYVKIMDN